VLCLVAARLFLFFCIFSWIFKIFWAAYTNSLDIIAPFTLLIGMTGKRALQQENLQLQLQKALSECARLREENAKLKTLLNLSYEEAELSFIPSVNSHFRTRNSIRLKLCGFQPSENPV
jgi:cell shape-determining protein MreC